MQIVGHFNGVGRAKIDMETPLISCDNDDCPKIVR
jgi:hypothetical protein